MTGVELFHNPKYQFKIYVREGKPGFVDDDCYVSREYSTFEDVYRELVNFNIDSFWRHLRVLQRITLQKDNDVEVKVNQSNYCIMIDELVFLGVTEKEFDEIIERI